MDRSRVFRTQLAINPTLKLSLPAVRGRRDQIADPGQAAALIAALPEADQALWATALYTGLRRGELQALSVGTRGEAVAEARRLELLQHG